MDGWIINLNHIKILKVAPDGSQTRTAPLVVVNMLQWTAAPAKKGFPQTRAPSAFFLLCVCFCGRKVYHTIPEVLHEGRNMLIVDLCFSSLKHEAEHNLPGCVSLRHPPLTQSASACKFVVQLLIQLRLCSKFSKYDINFSGLHTFAASDRPRLQMCCTATGKSCFKSREGVVSGKVAQTRTS